MQPFDGGKFDKRYEEVFKPAITAAGLEPYRVDKDPSVSVPIAEIEQGIRDSHICFADITEDNPNVWFELGFAIACNKEVVLVCSKERTTRFPFDVQHRSIIHYGTGSPSDYATLKKGITARIKAYLKKHDDLATSVSEITKVTSSDGLEQHEIVALAIIAASLDHPGDAYSAYRIKKDMESSGYTNVAAAIAMKSLDKQEFIAQQTLFDEAHEQYFAYSLSDKGWDWVLANKHKFNLKKPDEATDSFTSS
jgi:hypothetical protein